MKKQSIWINNTPNRTLSSLKKDIECDILIIGGGIAGLSTAYQLMDSKKNTVLIDKDKIGYGTTTHNTGKVTFMEDLVYHEIENNYNKEVARRYLESRLAAIDIIKDIISKNKIGCHFTKTNSYVFTDSDDIKDFEDEINFYKENNISYEKSELPISYPYKYALKTGNSYVFNPYEYLVGLKNIIKDKVKIYEKTTAIDIQKEEEYYLIKTNLGYTIKSKVVVVSSHYPPFIIPFLTPFKTRVESFFIGASSTLEDQDIQLLSHDKPTVSIRYYNDDNKKYLLYGRRERSITNNLDTRDDLKELEDEYLKYFNKKLDYFYHTHDVMTYDHLPFIGKIDDNMYIMTGFNKWGNTNGTIGGKVVSDLINNKNNKYISIFNPKREISFDKIKNIIIYNLDVGSRYIINKIKSTQSYYDDRVIIQNIDGEKCGIYIDDKGNKHIVSNICPHMKCNLIFNYVDKTWDCPCHGSRFDIDGNVIYGPSVKSIKRE